jgi:hypothetical protein
MIASASVFKATLSIHSNGKTMRIEQMSKKIYRAILLIVLLFTLVVLTALLFPLSSHSLPSLN